MSGNRYQALVRHDDPVLREIGQQLSSGQVRPAALLAIPEYQRVIAHGLSRLAGTATEAKCAAPVRSAP